ncbi:hypothetical protein SESBI_33077 [Sesbania bispinosa]|nr:hypothetical protein SESBI_33077 [Sesbania bispinosa]
MRIIRKVNYLLIRYLAQLIPEQGSKFTQRRAAMTRAVMRRIQTQRRRAVSPQTESCHGGGVASLPRKRGSGHGDRELIEQRRTATETEAES